MNEYPKRILSLREQAQTYIDAGMLVSSIDDIMEELKTIGYYRLRGYCFPLYDNTEKRYIHGTEFQNVLKIYEFDMELSHLLFKFLSKIEIALRAHVTDALLVYNNALILNSPAVFSDKKRYWQNAATVASEIARSNDVFIKHNFNNHEGEIPLWATVEVLSFGMLSKIVKNLKTGKGSAYEKLAANYTYLSKRGNFVKPSLKMLSSWIHSLVILRNMCAHNSRIYNRTINTMPEILDADKTTPAPTHIGLYQLILTMKYLRPSNTEWSCFFQDLKKLLSRYQPYISLSCMNIPEDWESHLML